MKTILVSGASGIVGYGILKSLRLSNESFKLIGTSIYDDSIAPAFCDVFELAPSTSNKNYADWLINVVSTYDVDLLFPGIEIDMQVWPSLQKKIQEQGAKACLNSPKLITLCSDKWKFYQRLRNLNLDYSIDSSIDNDFSILKEQFGLPFLLKPRKWNGSKNIIYIHDENKFNEIKKQIGSNLMAQPIIGSDLEEFTVAIFGDGNGSFTAIIAMQRTLSPFGFTEKAAVVCEKPFIPVISEMCEAFYPLGPTNFQFRKSNKKLKLLEINPRISSSTSIRAAFGYNESIMSIQYYQDDQLPKQPCIKLGRAVRYTEEHIFL